MVTKMAMVMAIMVNAGAKGGARECDNDQNDYGNGNVYNGDAGGAAANSGSKDRARAKRHSGSDAMKIVAPHKNFALISENEEFMKMKCFFGTS